MTEVPKEAANPYAMILALGTAQIISWGTLFYAIGVLGPLMSRELGISELMVFGSFTVGLVVSAVCSPWVGRLVDERGGRWILTKGSVVAMLAMCMLGMAINEYTVLLAWVVGGVAMAMVLYDPAFATLSQIKALNYRKAVTALTIMGAFASTVFWMVAHLLANGWGWRAAWFVFAWLHLIFCLPLHAGFIPRRLVLGAHKDVVDARTEPEQRPAALRWLSAAFALAAFVFAVCVVHVIPLLQTAGLTPPQAITMAMLIGPLQVVGRLVELRLSKRFKSVTLGFGPFILLIIALAFLLLTQGAGIAALAFVIALGCGNGVLTIARGTVPQEMFGNHRLGESLGRLARTSLFARALAPASLAVLATLGYSHTGSLVTMMVIALAGAVCYSLATKDARQQNRAELAAEKESD